jgi:CubicO group peptidase (beta-lactamase class C family)
VKAIPPLQKVNSALREFRRQHGVAAVGGSIVSSEEETITQVVGVRRRGSPDEVCLSDSWHIGSCTKSITAALWARLVELGITNWDAPLHEIFEDLGRIHSGWTSVTIRDALQCRAGFSRDVGRAVFRSLWEDNRPIAEQRSHVVERTLQYAPISYGKFVYSNLSYIIVGAAIDRVAKMSFEHALERYVLEPANLLTAGFGAPQVICGHKSRVKLLGRRSIRGSPADPDDRGSDNPIVYSSAGTLHLSLDDWSTLIKLFLANNDGNMLNDQSLTTIFRTPVQPGYGMAMGWMQSPRSLGVSYYMQGSNTLWSATSMLSMDRKRSVLIVCNDGRSSVLEQSVTLALRLFRL